MRQFKTIFSFELKSYFKNKIFLGITIFFMVLIAAVMFFPQISSLFRSNNADKKEAVLLVAVKDTEDTDIVQQVFTDAFPKKEVRLVANDWNAIKGQIEDGSIEGAFVLDDLTTYTYYVNNLTLSDDNTTIADQALQKAYQIKKLTGMGMTEQDASQLISNNIVHTTKSLGKDQITNFFYTYIMIFALYMVILLYGQMVATNVASEKDSRAMELLVTSAKPASMMFGKVLASCTAGLTQIVCIFGSAFLFYQINQSSWGDNPIIASIFSIPAGLLLYMILFFILGFLLYAFLFSAVGSLASKVEDINTSSMPVTLLFVAGFMIVMFSMTSGDVDSVLMKVCSYVPFTSPMAMFTRLAMSKVAFHEILISIALLVVSAAGIGILSAKIYRVGVLLYGNKPKLSTVLRSVWNA